MNQKNKFKKIKTLLGVFIVIIAIPLEVIAAPGYDQVAHSQAPKRVEKYGMTPIYGGDIVDGTYQVKVTCSSSFFRILDATLQVENGEMKAILSMYSNSYSHVYDGYAIDAAKDKEDQYIPLEKGDKESTFEIPVKFLNGSFPLAAFSKKKKKWYDRNLMIDAATLPKEALKVTLPDYDLIEEAISLYDEVHGTNILANKKVEDEIEDGTEEMEEAVFIDKKDGNYSVEVVMTGGSGRTSVTSPTWFYVKNQKGYAKLLFSSSYYDYMVIDGKTYINETTDGSNSTFTIPVTKWDEGMDVIADTTAMGDPLEIEYTLTFYSDTIGSVERIPQEATKKVIIIAFFIIVFGGIVNYFVKKRR